jgi:hypothetical protein
MTFATNHDFMRLVNYSQIECNVKIAIFPPTTSFLLSLPWAILYRVAHWRLKPDNGSNYSEINYPKTGDNLDRNATIARSQSAIALKETRFVRLAFKASLLGFLRYNIL